MPPHKRFEIEKLTDDFTKIILHYGYMESPRIPSALAQLRKSGLKFDIMTTSFFLGSTHDQDLAHLGHAAVAGQSVRRALQAGGERHRLLPRFPRIASSSSAPQVTV